MSWKVDNKNMDFAGSADVHAGSERKAGGDTGVSGGE
jgi:hypothetical protein